MTGSETWQQDAGESDGFLTSIIRALAIIVGVASLIFFATLPLTWPQQAVFGLLMLLIALWLGRTSNSYLITLTMMLMSMFATFRYGWWRITMVIDFFRDPGTHAGAVDAFFILILVCAEAYAFCILFLGYLQTIWPLRRAPVPLPDNPEEWPAVDLLIPTYNEPLDVVKYTAFAAMNIDWPADKLNVYILDDGNREEFRRFAIEAGVGYMTRTDNEGAKAGNINRALARLDAPFVAVFDSDHVPTRSFLQMTLGWFLRDKNLAMLQTPHHFYSPDPFERNLDQFRVIPNEGELFYGIVQDGNDFWNATFFCGSCAVLRRKALDEIGGIATETVTEDAHTSLKMQMNGWNTAYINIPQAAGLATERLSGHVRQRIRWARGMIQILRIDNPLFAKGLRLSQRLCYFNAMTHFMYALPRLIFLTAPLIYLILSHTNVPGYWAAILAYALPHLTLSNITNSRIQGQHRHSFWNEIYETVLAPYILMPTLLALINPKLGKFNVTTKGGIVNKSFFDARIAQPFLVLLLFNLVGLAVAIPRFFYFDRAHPGTVIMNALWVCFNIVTLGVATAVAREEQQRRQHIRINMVAPAAVRMPDGHMIPGQTIDVSSGGAAIQLAEAAPINHGESLRIVFPLRTGDAELPVTVVGRDGKKLRVQFDPLTVVEQELLTMVLYSRADTWLGWGESREPDQPIRSLIRILALSYRGLTQTLRSLSQREKEDTDGSTLAATRAVSLLVIIALLLGFAVVKMHAQTPVQSTATKPAPGTMAMAVPGRIGVDPSSVVTSPGSFQDTFTLKDAGVPQTIELHGIDSYHSINFSLSQTHVVKQASIHVYYHFSPSLIKQLSHIKLMLNGTLFATLSVPENLNNGDAVLEETLQMPADLLVRDNQLTFEFIGHYAPTCEDPANTVLWSRIDPNTQIILSGSLLPLADDLKLLPLPFLDPTLIAAPSIPVVFMSQPSPIAMQAAGVVTSYFGMLSDSRSVRFPVSVGTIPSGNVVLIAESASALPPAMNIGVPIAPTVAMRTNPNDPYGKLLVVTGASPEQMLAAAQTIALKSSVLQGPKASVSELTLPSPQAADAAPRWARTDQTIQLWDYTTAESMQGDGSVPLNAYFRIPPDIYYAENTNATLSLNYRYNSIPVGDLSSMQIRINNAFLGSIPLPPGKETSKVMHTLVPVPVVNLRPFSNSMSFDFTFQLMKKGGCQDTTPINMQGSILRDSYLDLRGKPHYAPMPNLEIFANAGFPFTRFADLHQTTVVLPTNPTPQEIELYLTLLGHFGAQTGYPALRVTVADSSAMQAGAANDFLVIGTGEDQMALTQLGSKLPVTLQDGGIKVQDTEGFFAPLHHAWWKIKSEDRSTSGTLTATGQPDTLIEGIESPYSPNRSIVLVNLKDAAAFDTFMTSFFKASQSSDISGTVSVLHGTQFQSFRIGNSVYYVGALPWWTWLSLKFMQVPWLVALFVLAVCLFLAYSLRHWLRQRARARLRLVAN